MPQRKITMLSNFHHGQTFLRGIFLVMTMVSSFANAAKDKKKTKPNPYHASLLTPTFGILSGVDYGTYNYGLSIHRIISSNKSIGINYLAGVPWVAGYGSVFDVSSGGDTHRLDFQYRSWYRHLYWEAGATILQYNTTLYVDRMPSEEEQGCQDCDRTYEAQVGRTKSNSMGAHASFGLKISPLSTSFAIELEVLDIYFPIASLSREIEVQTNLSTNDLIEAESEAKKISRGRIYTIPRVTLVFTW